MLFNHVASSLYAKIRNANYEAYKLSEKIAELQKSQEIFLDLLNKDEIDNADYKVKVKPCSCQEEIISYAWYKAGCGDRIFYAADDPFEEDHFIICGFATIRPDRMSCDVISRVAQKVDCEIVEIINKRLN